MKWQEELMKYSGIAYEAGKDLHFRVKRREGMRYWKIYLSTFVSHGEDEFEEED